jgi:hypothetical protein
MNKTDMCILSEVHYTACDLLDLTSPYFRTSSNEIQKTPSDAPCGIKVSLSCGVQIGESSDQSPFQE